MDALLMCGGRGTRLDAPLERYAAASESEDAEKPLFEVGGEPMVDRVAAALRESTVDTAYAVVSPHAPRTRRRVSGGGESFEGDPLPTVETPGEGYVPDLRTALEAVDPPVLTVAADLPLLAADAVDSVLDAHEGGSLTVCVPAALKRDLGASVDATFERGGRELAPTGVNVVADTDREAAHETDDVRLAVNVNRLSDADIAEELL